MHPIAAYTDVPPEDAPDPAPAAFSLGTARVVHPAEPPAHRLRGLDDEGRRRVREEHRVAWLQKRREGLGGSDASTLGGFNPYRTVYDLWNDKTGRTPLITDSDAARVGRMLEAGVLRMFREHSGLTTRRVGMLARKDCPWMMATPDALTSDGAGVEIKTTTERSAAQWDANPSDHAMAQAQWNMWVHGAEHWYIAVMFRDSGRFLWYRVERDRHLIDVLRERAAVMWHSYILTDTAPPLQNGEIDLESAKEAEEAQGPFRPQGSIDCGDAAAVATRSLARINERLRELKGLRKSREAEIVRMMGRNEYLYANGVLVATYSRNGNFAEKRYREECPQNSRRFLRLRPVLDRGQAISEDPEALRYVSRRLLVKFSGADLRPPAEGGEEAWLEAEMGP